MRGMKLSGSNGKFGASAVPSWKIVMRDTAVVVLICTALAILLNAVRSDGIPLVQKEDYKILVPCPEITGDTSAVPPDMPIKADSHVLIVDARSAEEFKKWHVIGAINVPFDYLNPTNPDAIYRIASSGAREVVVYGDGHDPDSGEQLARELSGKGIRNVRFVSGGAFAIMTVTRRGVRP